MTSHQVFPSTCDYSSKIVLIVSIIVAFMNVTIGFASIRLIRLILICVETNRDLLYGVITYLLMIGVIDLLSLNHGGFGLISCIIARTFGGATSLLFRVRIFWMLVPGSNPDASR